MRKVKDMKEIYTIGYAGYRNSLEMIRILQQFHVKCLIDIRSIPYSTYRPEFNKDNLSELLKKEKILYRHYPKEFGARQTEFINSEGFVDFEAVARSERFKEGLAKVDQAIEKGYVIALMCAEKDPKDCHRSILIGRAMKENGYVVKHITPPRKIETQEELERRCAEKQISMFDTGDPIETFYREQARKIAFKSAEKTFAAASAE